jgi:peptidoglycan/xylan/chitin deacetylase (PgdA/CDA1 family)
MAITFDDLPFAYGKGLSIDRQREAVDRVLATLARHRVTATMFVIGQTVTEQNRGLVDAIVKAGHRIGNHSFSHRDIKDVSVEEYANDIQRGGDAIAPWLTGPHFFRYPYLRQGDTAEKRDAILSWLSMRGIRVAPVTIDNNDYLYNQRLVDAAAGGKTIDVRGEYLDHMMQAAAYYDTKARTLIGRPITHLLLLHLNYLNSLYLDDLLQRFRDDGWSFITFEDALSDEVYSRKYDYAGVQGAGHLDAIKATARQDGR